MPQKPNWEKKNRLYEAFRKAGLYSIFPSHIGIAAFLTLISQAFLCQALGSLKDEGKSNL